MYLKEVEPAVVDTTAEVLVAEVANPVIPEDQEFYMVFGYTSEDEIWQPVYNTIISDEDDCDEECECECECCDLVEYETEAPMYESLEDANERVNELLEAAREANIFAVYKIVKIVL